MTNRSEPIRPFERLVGLADLARVALAPTAISNIWLVLLWSRAFEPDSGLAERPLGAMVVLCAGVAVGLYVFGMVLNDLLDARRDRLFAPGRPLVAGTVTPRAATLAAVISLLAALMSATLLGSREALACLMCAALIVFYNAAGKHLPALGLITLGLVRVANMLVANPSLEFTWLLWVTFSHVLLISAIGYVLERKRPRLYPPEVWALVGGWVFCTTAMVVWTTWVADGGPMGLAWLWVGPVAAAAAFAPVGWSMVRGAPDRRAGGRALILHGLAWLVVYDAAWLASAGEYGAAAAVGAMYPLTYAMVFAMRRAKKTRASDLPRSRSSLG